MSNVLQRVKTRVLSGQLSLFQRSFDVSFSVRAKPSNKSIETLDYDPCARCLYLGFFNSPPHRNFLLQQHSRHSDSFCSVARREANLRRPSFKVSDNAVCAIAQDENAPAVPDFLRRDRPHTTIPVD